MPCFIFSQSHMKSSTHLEFTNAGFITAKADGNEVRDGLSCRYMIGQNPRVTPAPFTFFTTEPQNLKLHAGALS